MLLHIKPKKEKAIMNDSINVNIELVEGGQFPALGTAGAGCRDLYARIEGDGEITRPR